jgi:hypothetical protein
MELYRAAVLEWRSDHVILVPVDLSFGHKNSEEQQVILERLQEAATAAGLDGSVVVFWNGGGKAQYRAPQRWKAFCQRLDLKFVEKKINAEFEAEIDIPPRRYLPTDEKAVQMLRKIYATCGEAQGAVCVLGSPDKDDNMTREEWHANYQYLCTKGYIKNIGSLYSTVLTPQGIETAKTLS